MDTKKKIVWLARLLSLAFCLLILLCVECGVRLLAPETHLDKITNVIERDQALFWRNRPGLNTTFAGAPVITNNLGMRIRDGGNGKIAAKKQGALRVVCLGESPTFGWGVKYEESYPAQLESLLRENSDREIEVINAAMIGHSSHQGKILLKSEIASFKPDLITIPYVINDIDKYRFFRSNGQPDKYLRPQNPAAFYARVLLDKSRFFRLYEKSLNYVIGRRASFDGKPVAVYRPLEVRAPLEDYRSNLKEMIDFAADNNIKTILIKFPVNLPVIKKISESDMTESKTRLEEGIKLAESKDCKKAVPLLAKSVKLNPYLSEAHYFLGVCHLKLGDKNAAEKAFNDAFASEAHRCGSDGQIYNKALEEIGAETKTPVVDVVKAFNERKDEYLFISPDTDPIHPNSKGHRIIAQAIFETIQRGRTLTDF